MKTVFTPGLLALCVFCAAGASAATGYTEARNDAMGGTGVASSHYLAAPLANPALLTRHSASGHFSLLLPSAGVQVTDADDIAGRADAVRDAWKAFDAAVDARNGASRDAAALREQLLNARHVRASGQPGISAVAALPTDEVAAAIFARARGLVSVEGSISDADISYLDQIANGSLAPEDIDRYALTSSLSARAAVISDVGLAFARELTTAGRTWSLGVSPKFQRVDLFNYRTTFRDYDRADFRAGDYHNTHNGINADIGAWTSLSRRWTLGVTTQNILPRTLNTLAVNGRRETFRIRPLTTAGIAWQNEFATAALDVDLTPDSGFAADEKRQFAALGGELNAWGHAQLRAGYRHNLAGRDDSGFTAGVGLSPFSIVHLDLSGMAGINHTYGVSAQLAFTF